MKKSYIPPQFETYGKDFTIQWLEEPLFNWKSWKTYFFIVIVTLLSLFFVGTASAASCTTGVYWNNPAVDTQNTANVAACTAAFATINPGDSFTVSGSSNNDGTYVFSSFNPAGGGYGQGSVIITGTFPNAGVDDTGLTVTFSTIDPPSPSTSNYLSYFFNEVASTSPSSTVQYVIINNPTQDLFNGILLLLIIAGFIIFYFK